MPKPSPPATRPQLRLVTAPEAEGLDERARVLAFLEGDEQAFAALAQLHQRAVYTVVRRYVRGPEDARDLAQKALLQAFAARAKVAPRLRREPQAFRLWLLRIAVNVGKNHARSARLWRMEPETALSEVADAGTSPGASLELAEQRSRMREAVLQLPKRQREVVGLRVDGGLSFGEIAQALGISENNAVVNFHYAVRRLKGLLAQGDEP